MAELGNIFGSGSSNKDQKIEVEMLDYGYVKDCTDWNQLSAIVDVLKSGKEGHYPDLIRVAEERLIELLPQKEKRRYFSMNHKTTPAEIAEAESELHSWQRTVVTQDETIQHSKSVSLNSRKVIPVRGSGVANLSKGSAESKQADIVVSQDERTKSLLAILNANQRKKFEKLQSELDVEDLTLVKRQYKAGLEKTKGNESFRIGDNQDAVTCYSKSLAYEPASAVVWANRAMAYIRLELFDLAEADSSVALLLDPTYVKAYSRRGLVRFKRGKYAEAMQDFSQALKLDPDNAELTKLFATAREKYLEVEGVSAVAEDEGVEIVEVPGPVDYFEVRVEHVKDSSSLLLPPLASLVVKNGTVVRAPVNTFVRINVVSDDESDDDEENDQEGTLGSTTGAFNRIAITEDDDSSDEEEEGLAQRAADLKEKGNALLKQGDAAGAVLAYSESLAAVPTYLPSLNNRAQAHLTLKAYQLSERDSSSVLVQEPNNTKALYRRAVALHALHRTGEALTDVEAVLALDPANALARELHIQLSSKSAPIPRERVVAHPPMPPPPSASVATIDVQKLRQKAQQLLGDGLNDKVIALLAQYLRAVDQAPFCELLQSDQTSLLHLLATAYSSTEDYGHAVAVQATILQIDPTNARALYKRAEGQLQLAAQATGEARKTALLLAEEDIEAAVSAQSGGTEVLALRQKLLRLRNTAPEIAATSPSRNAVSPAPVQTAVASTNSNSRQQSDAQKDLGNKAMTDKSFSTAIMHYSNAIRFDETNLAAFNNRALAHLKLNDNSAAEADATVVIGPSGDQQQGDSKEDVGDNLQVLRQKALCRRAQARRAIGEALLKNGVLEQSKEKLSEALQDLQMLLKQDPSNKTALVEQKLSKDALKKCTDQLTPLHSVSAAVATPEPVKKEPRADINRVSAMFGTPSSGAKGSSAAVSSPAAFGDLGMVARSSKKLNSSTGVSTPDVPSSPAVELASTPAKSVAPASAAKKAASSPTPSVVLSAAPVEPPKTVYEFERVWRGLKGRPDLFAQYIGCFKKATFKKVLKEAVSPDLVSFMWKALKDHSPSPQVQLKALSGFSDVPGFTLTLSLLPEEDLRCVRDILASLTVHTEALPSHSEEEKAARLVLQSTITSLRDLYGM